MKAAAFAASALNTDGSAASAFIAALSLARLAKAAALLAMLAFDAAFEAAFWNEFALLAKLANACGLAEIAARAAG